MVFSIISIILTVVAIIMVATNIVKDKYYPCMIYIVALFAIWSTTMLGASVVGSDISAELRRSIEALLYGWDIKIIAFEVSSVVVGWIVPVISKILFIEPEWVYKIILPMIFALCPTILYLVYSKQIDKRKAFLAAMFFIIMPVFFMEIPTIGKSMVAEVFLAIAMYSLIADWNKWVKFIAIGVSLALALWCHYTLGIIALMMFLFIGIVLFITQFFKKSELWGNRVTSAWMILVLVVAVSCAGFMYYSVASGGYLLVNIKTVATATGHMVNYGTKQISSVANLTSTEGPVINIPAVEDTYLNNQPTLVRTALGLDFNETTLNGKIFRIIQFVTQFLIVIGCGYILFAHRKYKFRAEFIAGIGACVGIILICIVVPTISDELSMTRFYHMSLFFLAPTLIIGVDSVVNLTGRICQKFR